MRVKRGKKNLIVRKVIQMIRRIKLKMIKRKDLKILRTNPRKKRKKPQQKKANLMKMTALKKLNKKHC